MAGRKSFTPKETLNAEQSVRDAWEKAGAVTLEGPLAVKIDVYFPRPKAHFNSKGELKPNAPAWVTKRPDGDNILKLVTDALNEYAWKDDSFIAQALVIKRYPKCEPWHPRMVIYATVI